MDVNIGMSEDWNDTYIPSVLYFSNVRYSMIKQHNWQITNAEILGGIDGNFIYSNNYKYVFQTKPLITFHIFSFSIFTQPIIIQNL